MEYFYFQRSTGKPEALDQGGYFDLTPLDVASELPKQTVTVLEEMGVPVEYSHHEVAPSQHEIDLKYRDGLTMADSTMIYRLVVKEVASKTMFTPASWAQRNRSDLIRIPVYKPGKELATRVEYRVTDYELDQYFSIL